MQKYGKTLNDCRIFPIFYKFASKFNRLMKYFETYFTIKAPASLMQDARDILSAIAGEAGFETFEETDDGLKGYVQQTLFEPSLLGQLISNFPIDNVDITYSVAEAEDKDWNEQWEQEGFAPIPIGQQCIVHDGRHFDALPKGKESLDDFDIQIEIDAHLAFGTGTHETTQMMLENLLSLQLEGRKVLDCGCGTGILGIAALKAGAAKCVGYDIDEWSVDNARHNAVINQVDNGYTSLLGDASVLNDVNETFDVVMANINRNILLADMPAFRRKMNQEGILLLSGFYADDMKILSEESATLSLTVIRHTTNGEWACMMLR